MKWFWNLLVQNFSGSTFQKYLFWIQQNFCICWSSEQIFLQKVGIKVSFFWTEFKSYSNHFCQKIVATVKFVLTDTNWWVIPEIWVSFQTFDGSFHIIWTWTSSNFVIIITFKSVIDLKYLGIWNTIYSTILRKWNFMIPMYIWLKLHPKFVLY